jgi:hypothetical protein
VAVSGPGGQRTAEPRCRGPGGGAPANEPASRSSRARTPCATPMPSISSKPGPICEKSNSCWVTAAFPRQHATFVWLLTPSAPPPAHWTCSLTPLSNRNRRPPSSLCGPHWKSPISCAPMATSFAGHIVVLCPCGKGVCCMPSNTAVPPLSADTSSGVTNAATNAMHTTRARTAIAPSASP